MTTMNVFKGPNSLVDYFNPDLQPPVPLVEIPDILNPFREDGVRIFAKMLTSLPGQNVKALPAMNMLRNEPEARSKSVVEASSGSTALSLAMISRVLYANDDVTAHVTNKKTPNQLRMLRFFGLKVSLYGGLAQQEPTDPRGIMSRLRKLARANEQTLYPGQYDNDLNWKSHVQCTGRQIYQQLPEIDVLATTVGTGGCITGTGVYLKSQKPSVKVLGIFNVMGDSTPGPRHFENFDSSKFPWRETIDHFEHVASKDSFALSMALSREGIICGPSSGEALKGLFQYIEKAKEAGTLSNLMDSVTGELHCVFICCDLPYVYLDTYFDKLEADQFPGIYNENLLKCDQDKYDERWELSPKIAHQRLSSGVQSNLLCTSRGRPCPDQRSRRRRNTSSKAMTVIDLRQLRDYDAVHICKSISSPLLGLSSTTSDIYDIHNSKLLELMWTKLRTKFDQDKLLLGSKKSPLLIICYDGEVSRLSTSILRAKGYTAFSIFGGFGGLAGYIGSK